MKIWCKCIVHWITKATNTCSEYVIRIDVYNATMVMWTRLNAMVYVHCPSCYLWVYIFWVTYNYIKYGVMKVCTSSTMLCPIFNLWLPCWVSRQQSFYEDDILQLTPAFSIKYLSPTQITRVQDSTGASVLHVNVPIINRVTQLYCVIISVQNGTIVCNWTAPASSCYYCDWIQFKETNAYVGVNCT